MTLDKKCANFILIFELFTKKFFYMAQKIYIYEFIEEWNKAYDNWYGKFSAKAKTPISSYNDGYSTMCFEPRENFWFFIWNGPTCLFGKQELISGVTLVTGTKTSPMFFSPTEFKQMFDFTNLNPFTGEREPEGTSYFKALHCLKEKVISMA